ncbi:unnamed protein product [Notodromas monacha]|uniref:Pseudouridine synthase II N-terminal domain-containing protein n=1 Tax=Notodromas monacha TaxID=399045 RepID=A0A7R9BZQ9_9CRUS|nr:unnamed protein product [Notodromas monacha]CAG0923083.1 unnamed protein product [Notodromas monacha]
MSLRTTLVGAAVGKLSEAEAAWRSLNGMFCVYKPAGITRKGAASILSNKLAASLNRMEVRPPRRRVQIENENGQLVVTSVPSYADHPLVVGERYIKKDVEVECCDTLDLDWSGVTVWRVGHSKKFKAFQASNPISSYAIQACLGKATDNFFSSGKVVEKASFKHVEKARFSKYISSIVARHQKQAYAYSGVHPDSKAAYELAKTGLVRPSGNTPFLIYGLSLTHFKPPDFTLELHCVGDSSDDVHGLVHEMALDLKTVAHTCAVRRFRYGPFDLKHALLKKHWSVEYVLENINELSEIVDRDDFIPEQPWFKEADAV